MTRDIFICSHGRLLPDWSKACPAAITCLPVALANSSANQQDLYWIHAETDHQDWIVSTLDQVLAATPNARIVVLANMPDQAHALLAFNHGAVGYCHAYSPATMLTEVRTVVLHGGVWVGRDLLQRLVASTAPPADVQLTTAAQLLSRLTAREREVAIEAARGMSNKQIARTLNITERTVKAHLSSIFTNLGFKDRLQLALILNGKSS